MTFLLPVGLIPILSLAAQHPLITFVFFFWLVAATSDRRKEGTSGVRPEWMLPGPQGSVVGFLTIGSYGLNVSFTFMWLMGWNDVNKLE